MFTGLIEEIGAVGRMTRRGREYELRLKAPKVAAQTKVGDSISVSGACLTVGAIGAQTLDFHIGVETAARTKLGQLRVGEKVNLERAATPETRLGGHLVNGHVDCLGTVSALERRGETVFLKVRLPQEGSRYVVPQGSIALDGVSLTPVSVNVNEISIALIPYTVSHTTLGQLRRGDKLNVEFDILAKYTESVLEPKRERLSLAELEKEGY